MTDTTLPTKPVYHVVDQRNGTVVGKYMNKTRARNEVDKRDLAYGAARHAVHTVHPGEANEVLKKLGAGKPHPHADNWKYEDYKHLVPRK